MSNNKIEELRKICEFKDLEFLEKEIKKFNLLKLDDFATIKELVEKPNKPPHNNGIYIVLTPKNYKIPAFRKSECMRHIEKINKDKKTGKEKITVIKWYDDLESRWEKINKNENTNILYIGKASGKENKLRERLRQYIMFGGEEIGLKKSGNNHAGGRAIWQICAKNHKEDKELRENLIIAWFIYESEDDDIKRETKGEKTEAELLENLLTKKYSEKYKDFPLANKKQGG